MITPEDQPVIRVSYGTAIVLGLAAARQDCPPTTAYLLWDPGCRGACLFCPRAGGNAGEERLSRVTWPEFPLPEVIARLTNRPGVIRRICLQTGWNPEMERELVERVRRLAGCGLPLCVTIHPAQPELAATLLESGAAQVGIGLDAASAETYGRCKQRPWETDFPAVERLCRRFPGKIEVHLIFGLGDSERTFLETMETLIGSGGEIALFAFTPMGSLKRRAAPDIAAWRRIQMFRHLRQKKRITLADCRFAGDRLISCGLDESGLVEELADGTAFRTSGCGDCNRPYYNERPGGILFNFPRPLTPEEARQCLREMDLRPRRA